MAPGVTLRRPVPGDATFTAGTPLAAGTRLETGMSHQTRPTQASPTAGREQARNLGRELADALTDPATFARSLCVALSTLIDPSRPTHRQRSGRQVAISPTVPGPLVRAMGRAFLAATRDDSPATLLLAADHLLHEPGVQARRFAFNLLAGSLAREPERTWQLIRRAAREASDRTTIDMLAPTMAQGVLAERFRWAELEQLVYAPSPWERRLAASTVATMPFIDRDAGRDPEVAGRGVAILRQVIGDADPAVQQAISRAYRSLSVVDLGTTTDALREEAMVAAATGDGHRARVIRDALVKLDGSDAAMIRAGLAGIRSRPGAPSTSRAAATSARFTGLDLGRPAPELPLI